jgi:hypothetical protein
VLGTIFSGIALQSKPVWGSHSCYCMVMLFPLSTIPPQTS